MKKALCIFLVFSLLFAFAACSSTSGGNEETTAPDNKTPVNDVPDIKYEEDDLPELDFGGKKVTVLAQPNSINFPCDFSVECLTGDPVNDSIYNRERAVEERLGVNIVISKFSGDFSKMVLKQLNSSDDSYQIYAYDTDALSQAIYEKAFVNLYNVDYLNLDKPWWSQTYIDKTRLKDNLYMVTGSITPSLLRTTYAVYCNDTLAQEYASSKPELADLYSMVESGNWTYDKFYELGSDIYRDININAKVDRDDLYGIGFSDPDPIFSGFDINILGKTDDGWFEVILDRDDLVSACEKIHDLLYKTSGCLSSVSSRSENFGNGLLLFNVDVLKSGESLDVQYMEDSYSILPFPKYDAEQANYYTHANYTFISLAISSTSPNPEIAGAVLEAMASYSYRDTQPLFLNKITRGEYYSDSRTRAIMDNIVNNINFEPASVYLNTIGDGAFDYYINHIKEIDDVDYAEDYDGRVSGINSELKTYNRLLGIISK